MNEWMNEWPEEQMILLIKTKKNECLATPSTYTYTKKKKCWLVDVNFVVVFSII